MRRTMIGQLLFAQSTINAETEDGSRGYTKEKSGIVAIGLSIHSTPVEIREKLAIPEAEWPRAIEELCNLNHTEEASVLSTCNRMEIYVVALSQHHGVKEVTEWMSKLKNGWRKSHHGG